MSVRDPFFQLEGLLSDAKGIQYYTMNEGGV